MYFFFHNILGWINGDVKTTKKKHLNNTWKTDLKVRNSPLELDKDLKPINIFIDDMDKFEWIELRNKRMLETKGVKNVVDDGKKPRELKM